MLKIKSDYEPEKQYKELGEPLKSGDIVYCRGSQTTRSFYGIYVYGIGVIELENGSSAYMRTSEQLYLKQQVSYWTIEKKFKDVELIINDSFEEVSK